MKSFHILCGVLLLNFIEIALSANNVIIIGAGPAGVAAATKLLENEFQNVTVLEAENRIGGRVRSVKFGDAFVDLGAEWCHGQENNIVYEMVKDLNILQHTPSDRSFARFYSNGEQIDESIATDLDRVMSRDFETIAKEYNYTLPKDQLTSAENYILEIYNNTILKQAKSNEAKYKILLDAIPYLERGVVSMEGSFSWSEPSYINNYQECKGDLYLTWQGYGFKTILDVLKKSFPDPSKKLPLDEKVQLNKKVTKIRWNGTEALVQCSDGSSYSANHVIFTPSIGVLKDQHQELFVPNLPAYKQEAIRAVGFGGVMKIVLKFPKRWWGDDPFFSADFIWGKSDLEKSGLDFPHGTIKGGVSWITQINGVVTSANNSVVLIAWVSGGWVPDIEKLPSETLKNGAYYVLKKFLSKHYDVEEPNEVLYSTWCSNPNFRGTWSFETVESHRKNQSNQEDLSKPLLNSIGVPLLLFAGESTNPAHYATVQGAIESGHREANRILKLVHSIK